jgi:hypothetical protein
MTAAQAVLTAHATYRETGGLSWTPELNAARSGVWDLIRDHTDTYRGEQWTAPDVEAIRAAHARLIEASGQQGRVAA